MIQNKICKNCKKKFANPLNGHPKEWENREFCSTLCANIYNGKYCVRTEAVRKKQSEFMKEKAPWKGKHLPQYLKDKLSIAAKNRKIGTKSGFQKGSKHWNWQGGISTEKDKRINDTHWKYLRKQIYKRDGWTCQICGKHCRGVEIQCHHILPAALGGTDNKSNLETLCNKHHRTADRQFLYIL